MSFKFLIKKPLSLLTVLTAGFMITLALYQLINGIVYIEKLNWVDGTTIIMVGILLVRGVVLRWEFDTDLQAVSIALIGALSFIFTYEALYKLSFYAFPWRMPGAELREFVIQVGIALTALVGFAFDRFNVSKLSKVFTIVFIAIWIIWLLVGFPQLESGKNFYPVIINVPTTFDMIYLLGRATKVTLCLVYIFLFK
jgi:hypothetical protein